MAGDVSRRNGARSRGPVSVAGKQRSRLNALRHGLAAAPSRAPDAESAGAVAGPASVLTGERRRRALERARLLGLPMAQGPEASEGAGTGTEAGIETEAGRGLSDDAILTSLSLAVADADLEVEAIERRKLALIEEATILADLEATLRTQHHDALYRAPVARAQGPRPSSPQAEHDDEDAARAIGELRTMSMPGPRRHEVALLSQGIGGLSRSITPGETGIDGPSGLAPATELAAWADVADAIRRLDRYANRAETQRRRAWRELLRRLHGRAPGYRPLSPGGKRRGRAP